MRLLTVLAPVLVAGLVAAGAASPKGITPSGTVCGQSTCFAVHGQAAAALLSWETPGPWAELDACSPAPYYTIRLRIDQEPRVQVIEQVLYVPTRHMVRIYDSRTYYGPQPVGPYWRSISKSAERAMNRIVSGFEPHHAPRAWLRPNVG